MRILVVILIVLGFAGLFLVGGWSLAFQQARLIRTWQPVPARIVKCAVRWAGPEASRLAVEYTYAVGGRVHTGHRLAPLDVQGDEAWAKALARRYQPDSQTTAYVNPQDPDQAYLLPQTIFTPYTFALLAGPILLIGLVRLIRGGAFRGLFRGPVAELAAPHDWYRIAPAQRLGPAAAWALLAVGLWYGYGAVVALHYAAVAREPSHLQAGVFLALYAVLGLIPLWVLIKRVRLWAAYGEPRLDATLPRFQLRQPLIVRLTPVFRSAPRVREVRLALTCCYSTGLTRKRLFVLSAVLARDTSFPAGPAATIEHEFEATRKDLPWSRPWAPLQTPRVDWQFEMLLIPAHGPVLYSVFPVELLPPTAGREASGSGDA